MDVLDRLDAEQDWRDARRKLLYEKVVCLFKTCSIDLLAFENVRKSLHIHQKRYLGLQVIPLEQIKGSVGRFNDFSSRFLPLNESDQERWQRVDMAMMQGKAPPIDVYQVGQVYYVLDGNHRVSVARYQGLESIEAYVTEFQTPLGFESDDELEPILIKSEQQEFLDLVGDENFDAASSIIFTCPGCYKDIIQQLEIYRQGIEEKESVQLSIGQIFTLWYEEAYLPGTKAIKKFGLLTQFPDRTEADLYIWSWRNNKSIEEIEHAQEKESSQE